MAEAVIRAVPAVGICRRVVPDKHRCLVLASKRIAHGVHTTASCRARRRAGHVRAWEFEALLKSANVKEVPLAVAEKRRPVRQAR